MKVILLLYKIVFLSLADVQPKSGVYTVGDFMTRKEDLHVVKPTTTVDEGIVRFLNFSIEYTTVI